MLTMDEIKKVASLIDKYECIANNNCKNGDIEIRNSEMYFIVNGELLEMRKLDSDDIKKQLETIEYKENVFSSTDVRYSPFEADKMNNKIVWLKDYKWIRFPYFLPIIHFSVLATGKVPDIIDFCKIYLLVYTETVPQKELINDRNQYYTKKYSDRENICNDIQYTDGQILKNKILRFKKKYLKYVKNLPFNEFTTEQLCSRIFKLYGSCIRNFYHALRFNKFGKKTYYSMRQDMSGIGGYIDDIPYYGNIDSENAGQFWSNKVGGKNQNLEHIGIKLKQGVSRKQGLYIISDDRILEIVKMIDEKLIDRFVEIEY